jgi:rhamnosyltransferase
VRNSLVLVNILLASYNGERYIESQLLSLIGQSYKDWRLLIHDDGSTDTTIQIIKKWTVIDKRICLIEDGVVCGSAASNFMHLLQFADANFVMFCDQDDIWVDNKIEVMLNAIQKKDQNIPQVVYSNSYVWKSEKGILGKATLTFPKNIEQFLFLNSGQQGCVAIFNRVMCSVLSKWEGDCAMHDHLLHLAGLSLGEVEYLPLCLMLYRNHENNVTGGTTVKVNNYESIIKNRKIPVVSKKHYDSVNRFYLLFKDVIDPYKIRKIELFLQLPQQNNLKRLKIIFFENYQLFNSRLRLVVKLFIRPYMN